MGLVEKKFESMKTPGYTRDIFSMQYFVAGTLNPKDGSGGLLLFISKIKSLINGDAELICWTKGVNIPDMEGKPVGRTLIDYLNSKTRCGKVTVVNDTITSLFAIYSGHDAYWFDRWYRYQYGRVLSFYRNPQAETFERVEW
ncbi:hypothetical protein MASR1M31_21380 [Porphyromonadaceae bacterium]